MTAFHRSAEWFAFRRVQRPRIEARLPLPCPHCKRAVWKGQAWHVAHIVAVSVAWQLRLSPSNVTAAHKRCNLSDGGRMGAARTNRARKRKDRGEFPSW